MLSQYTTQDNFLIYLEEENDCIGFVTGLVPNRDKGCSTEETVKKNYPRIIKQLILKPWLLFHPIIISEYHIGIKIIFDSIFKIKTNKIEHNIFVDSIGLIDIAVNSGFQGKGYSTILLKNFENHCKKIGYNKFHLSVKPENINAIKTYKKNGWIEFEILKNQITFVKEIK
jgi:GNAT superfamily N-acetyltransferase